MDIPMLVLEISMCGEPLLTQHPMITGVITYGPCASARRLEGWQNNAVRRCSSSMPRFIINGALLV